MRDPKTAIRNEFSAYYHGDELPPAGTLEQSLEPRSRASAARLRRAVGEANLPALIQLLENLRDQPEHPLHADIAASSLIHWPDDPAMWTAFQHLIDRLVAELRP